MKLIDEWHKELARLWSIRIALLWGAVCGLYGAWGAFQDLMPAWAFGSASMLMSMAIVGARLTKQPGVE